MPFPWIVATESFGIRKVKNLESNPGSFFPLADTCTLCVQAAGAGRRSEVFAPVSALTLIFMKAFPPAALCAQSQPCADRWPDDRVSAQSACAPLNAECMQIGLGTKDWPGHSKEWVMKNAGLLVMPAGFFLTIAAIVLFPDPLPRAAFILCGLAVEGMGLGVAIRGHMPARGDRRP